MFIIQVTGNIYNMLNETTTNIKVNDMSTLPFPCVFRLVIRPGYNRTKLNNAGYEGVEKYFLGQSKYNMSMVGWAGHSEDGGILGTVQGRQGV